LPSIRKATVARKPDHREEHEATVNPLRAERRVDFGVSVVTILAWLFFCPPAAGASCARRSHALSLEGNDKDKPRAKKFTRREYEAVFARDAALLTSPRLRGEVRKPALLFEN
jgi:hypothetical protein